MLHVGVIKGCLPFWCALQAVAQEFSAHVLACNIYIVEAHPVDGWSLPMYNEDFGICYKKPTSTEEVGDGGFGVSFVS
jgi:hypothetical protein